MSSRPTSRLGSDPVVADRYVPEKLLGRGGMGTVWRARDELLQRTVALKEIELPPSLPDDQRAATKARILREARTAARLSHPNAVTMFDVIEEEGRSFIVMELLDAESLSEVIRRRGPLDPAEAARIGLGILGALEAAHAEGIVHRDVKPGNVMVADRLVKLADFGIATIKGDPKITQTGLILGSPSYMAPEQARSESATPATDMWGLGVTLYTAVEGVGPFERGEPIPTLTAILTDDPRPMQRAGRLEGPIRDLLEKDPERRPRPPAMRRSLQEVTEIGGGARTIPSDRPVATTQRMAAPRTADDQPPARRREPASLPAHGHPGRWLGALAALALVVLAAALVPGWLADRQETDTPARRDAPAGGDQGANEDADDDAAPSEGNGAPEGWETYTHPETGYQIAHPPDWTVQPIDTRTDFVAPNRDYLRVDYTTTPGSTEEDHVRAWQAQSESFAADYGDYREIRIEPTRFREWPGALWEYTYEDRHAYNLGFTASPDYGFALNLVTSADTWDEAQATFESFKASFRAPG